MRRGTAPHWRSALIEPPATVASLRVVPRRSTLVRVTFEDETHVDLPADAVFSEGLEIGLVLDDAQLGHLISLADTSAATSAALSLLAYRARSEMELRNELRKRGHHPEAIDRCVVLLHEWRYLDDPDFARRWVESRSASKPRSQRMLETELRNKGVDREIVREVIAEAGIDDRSQAEQVARSRWPKLVGEEPNAAKRKLSAYLARRGFGSAAIRHAIQQVSSGNGDDEFGDFPQ